MAYCQCMDWYLLGRNFISHSELCTQYTQKHQIELLDFSGPLFTIMLDYLLHAIGMSSKQSLGVMIAFLGVVLTINGHFLYFLINPDYNFDSKFQYILITPFEQVIVSIVLIIFTFGWAYSISIVKLIKNATHFQLNAHYGVCMMMLAGIVYPFTSMTTTQQKINAFWNSLLWQGIPLAFGQAFFSYALTLTKKSGMATMMGFMGVVLSYLISIFRYGEDVNWICICGTVLVVLGISKIVFK